MSGMIAFVLAAVVTAGNAPAVSQQGAGGGAQVQATATVTILRAERASEVAEPGGLTRHVSRRSDGSTTIVFE